MFKDLADCLKLVTEADGLEGYLSIIPGFDPAELTMETLQAQLEAIGILAGCINTGALEDLIACCLGDPESTCRELIAVGVAPVPGQAGSFRFSQEIEKRIAEIAHREECLNSMDPDKKMDEAIGMDFRSQSAFIIVRAKQELGTLISPTEGTDGQDIYGATIPAKRGQGVSLDIGSGVCIDDENKVIAEIDGVLVHSREQLRVDATLQVVGGVDYSTGNINFPGDVEVRGAVQDCFVVDSDGSVRIEGLVQAATIRSRKQVILEGGVAGREKAEVFAGRGLVAKYLDATKVHVHGTATVRNEVNQCDLTVHGYLDCSEAAIRGGRIEVTEGLAVGVLGGAGGIHTKIVIGHLPEPEGLVVRIVDLIQELEASAADAEMRLNQLKANAVKVTASQAEELTELEYEFINQKGQLDSLKSKASDMAELIEKSIQPVVKIMKRASRGVQIFFPGWRVEICDELKGPVELILDGNNEVRLIDSQSGSIIEHGGKLKVFEDSSVLSMNTLKMLRLAA